MDEKVMEQHENSERAATSSQQDAASKLHDEAYTQPLRTERPQYEWNGRQIRGNFLPELQLTNGAGITSSEQTASADSPNRTASDRADGKGSNKDGDDAVMDSDSDKDGNKDGDDAVMDSDSDKDGNKDSDDAVMDSDKDGDDAIMDSDSDKDSDSNTDVDRSLSIFPDHNMDDAQDREPFENGAPRNSGGPQSYLNFRIG